jgi:serine/threonine protein kinase
MIVEAAANKYVDEFTPARFRTVKKLGAGSYGAVALVKDNQNGKLLVLKRLNKKKVDPHDMTLELGALMRLRRVCRQTVVCYAGFFQNKTSYYLLTDYLGPEWTTLENYTREHRGPIRGPLAAKIANALVQKLAIIHRAGVAHRDLKPDNILIHRGSGDIRFIDVGLACWAGECERYFTPGTDSYGAPELHAVDDDHRRRILREHPRIPKRQLAKQTLHGEPEPHWTLNRYAHADWFSLGGVIYSLMARDASPPRNLTNPKTRAETRAVQKLHEIARDLRQHRGPDILHLLNSNPLRRI